MEILSLTTIKKRRESLNLNQFLMEHARTVSADAAEVIVHQGQANPPLYFLRSGFLKACYVTEGGKQSIKSFIQPGGLVGCLDLDEADESSTFSIVALEPCQLFCFSLQKLRLMVRSDLELANEIIDRLLKLAQSKEKREREFLTLSPAERFARLRIELPTLIQRVTQNDIASYLGITAVGLSRLKGRAIQKATNPVSASRNAM
jgi:CRP-like cAMP-binding protein